MTEKDQSQVVGFGADDFISFDFDGQDDSPTSEPGPSSRPWSPRRPEDTHSQADDSPTSIASAHDIKQSRRTTTNSKKRKAEAEDGLGKDGAGRSRRERERASARGTPWSVDVDWNTARNAAQQLHREMIAFERWIAPTKEEHQARKMVIRLISNAINSQWRDAEVLSFGSQDTELYLPQGDIDLVVVSRTMGLQRRENVLRAMAACLRKNNLATNVQVIAKAKVPIIKFVCTHGKYRCDISVNQTNGLKAAEWVNEQQDRTPAIRPLIMLTKHLLQQRGMSEVYTGGLGSFSVIILVISFMQMHPRVQRGEIDPARNLGVLFLDFLELYGKNFGYDDTGISVVERGSYFHKSHRGWKDVQRPFKASIEDPQNVENDIATGSYNIISVRSSLAGAFDILTNAVCQRGFDLSRGRGFASSPGRQGPGSNDGRHRRFEQDPEEAAREAILNGGSSSNGGAGLEKDPRSLLGSIIGVSKDLIKNRKDIETLYHSGILQRKLGKSPPRRSPSPGPSHTRRPPEPREPPLSESPPPPPPAAPRSMLNEASRKRRVEFKSDGVESVIHTRDPSHLKQPHHSTPVKAAAKRWDRNDSTSAAAYGEDDAETLASMSGDEERDSRYAAHSKNGAGDRRPKKRRDFLEVPEAYISEESEEEESGEELSVSFEEGEIRPSESMHTSSVQRKRRLQGDSQQRFWLEKGVVVDEDDEEL